MDQLDDMKRSTIGLYPGDRETSKLGYNFNFWMSKLSGVRSSSFSTVLKVT